MANYTLSALQALSAEPLVGLKPTQKWIQARKKLLSAEPLVGLKLPSGSEAEATENAFSRTPRGFEAFQTVP